MLLLSSEDDFYSSMPCSKARLVSNINISVTRLVFVKCKPISELFSDAQFTVQVHH